jgi:hypothetical protein
MAKDLSKIINKITKNKKIIELLNKNEKQNAGFLLGRIEYFDDIHVLIMYGITLDKEDKSKAKIFSYQLCPYSQDHKFKIEDSFPQIPEFADYPPTEEVKKTFKMILKNPKERLIDYSPFIKKD